VRICIEGLESLPADIWRQAAAECPLDEANWRMEPMAGHCAEKVPGSLDAEVFHP